MSNFQVQQQLRLKLWPHFNYTSYENDAVCCCGCLGFRGETLAKFEALEVAGRPDGLTIFIPFASAALETLRWKLWDFVDLGCQLRLS
ncbi:hypothetical protein T10_8241 [Trichinella papuae]|uniref:Uncharacterized protein n=1 Tax=Trichinella papuae TaxID=268474 RepID=A0A0V1MWX5_9BILA|nr:hypothetical protein T10_8241 [Trichinella papuae]